MRSVRSAVVGVLVVLVLLSVPVSAFAASMRGGGVQGTGDQTIHVKLDQPSGGVASGTISYVAHGEGGGTFSADFIVTGGDLAAGDLSGTVTVTVGAPPTVFCLQAIFRGTIRPGGAGVGGFSAFTPCFELLFGVPLDGGNIVFSP